MFSGCLLVVACERNKSNKFAVATTSYNPYPHPIPSDVFIRVNKLLGERYQNMNVVVYPTDSGYKVLIAAVGPIDKDAERAAQNESTDLMVKVIAEDFNSSDK